MGIFREPKGIKLCEKCGQLHGVLYDCGGVKGVQPVKSEFPRLAKSEDFKREPEISAVDKIRGRLSEADTLELGPGQEIGLRMELGQATLLRQVGGVQIILEIRGGQSFTVTDNQFVEILDHGLNGEEFDGWTILLGLCAASVFIFSFFVFFMG